MLKLIQVLDLAKCAITEGKNSTLHCYGQHAYNIKFKEPNHMLNGHIELHCVIDRITQQIYEIELHNSDNNKKIRWVDKYYKKSYNVECASKQTKYSIENGTFDPETKKIKSKDDILKLIELLFK